MGTQKAPGAGGTFSTLLGRQQPTEARPHSPQPCSLTWVGSLPKGRTRLQVEAARQQLLHEGPGHTQHAALTRSTSAANERRAPRSLRDKSHRETHEELLASGQSSLWRSISTGRSAAHVRVILWEASVPQRLLRLRGWACLGQLRTSRHVILCSAWDKEYTPLGVSSKCLCGCICALCWLSIYWVNSRKYSSPVVASLQHWTGRGQHSQMTRQAVQGHVTHWDIECGITLGYIECSITPPLLRAATTT
jgi:hypothetical protein